MNENVASTCASNDGDNTANEREAQVSTFDQTLGDDIINVQKNAAMSYVTQRSEEGSEKCQKKKNGPLAERQFVPRNSYLTDLFEVNHIRTIYNIFVVMFLMITFNAAAHEYIVTGTISFGLKTIKSAFGSVSDIALIWTIMAISTLASYVGFLLWSNQHIKLVQKPGVMKVWDYISLAVFVFYQVAFIVIPAQFILERRLPPAASLLLLAEQVRMLMKTHAFVRSNVPRVLTYRSEDENNQGKYCPEFSKFLYFMFAPTLIYRDEYPRTKSIRWKVVFWNFTEVLTIVFYSAFIFECFIIQPSKNYGLQIFEPRLARLILFSTMLPGIILYLFGFYCVLHAWQNAMAELLKFADRLFYKDWWNSTSYSEFYRTWNILVHDWLHQYIYRDFYIKFHSKAYATVMTFIVSAIFHEYIVIVAFRFFYPMIFVFMGVFSVILVLIKNCSKYQGNIYIWISIITGQGCMYTFYPMEFYARANCPPYDDPWLDLLLPRSWICHNILNSTVNTS